MHSHGSKITYRPDIDGLRGVAILSVVIFHAFPGGLSGGYIGVDVFFVISGFLISSIIFNDLERNSFSFLGFYARRIRRIFPALALVLLFCGIFGWFVLVEDEYARLGKHLMGGALFWTNIQMKNEVSYFAASAESKQLLHLWSLAIEEQYYIVFPVVVVAVYNLRRSWLLAIILMVTAYSFAKNILITDKSVEKAFFLPKTRIWELLVGVVLAYQAVFRRFWLRRLLERARIPTKWLESSRLREATAVGGMAALIAGWLLLNKSSLFPGWWALLPTLGAAMLIASGHNTVIGRFVLANPLCKWVGWISFSLYLWHWPLLSFSHVMYGGMPSALVRTVLVALSFLMAALTTYGLERPIRFGGNPRAKVTGLIIAMAMIVVMGWGIKSDLVHPRNFSEDIHKIIIAKSDWGVPANNAQPLYFDNHEFQLIRSLRAETTLFMGDSNMDQYGQRIGRIIAESPSQASTAVFATFGGCPPIPYVIDTKSSNCDGLLEAGLRYAQRPEVERVVIGAAWFEYFTWRDGRFIYKKGQYSGGINPESEGQNRALDDLGAMIHGLRQMGKKVFIVLNIPTGRRIDPQSMLVRDFWNVHVSTAKEGIDKLSIIQSYGLIREKLIRIALASGAIVIDPMDFLCNENTCPIISSKGEPIYKDASHLRPSYAREFVTFLDQTIF